MNAPLQPEVAVIGASLGGVLAAFRAAHAGCSVLLAAEHAWLGGQFTAQAVPADEHPLIEEGAGYAPGSYLQFRSDLRALYRAMPGFQDRASLTAGTNPGDGWVSRLCVEPVHAARALERLLAPQVAAGRLRIWRGTTLLAAHCLGHDVQELLLRRRDGRLLRVQARCYVDGTDTGELLLQAQHAYRVGKEAQSEFNEPDAPAKADPLDQQPVTHVMALRAVRDTPPGGHPIVPAPAAYAQWRQHRLPHFGHLLFSPHLPGRGPGVSASLPLTGSGATLDWWRYRRIVSAAQWPSAPHAQARDDVTLLNWAQNDYALHPLLDGPLPRAEVQARARELTMCLVHWLQTEAPRPDGGHGFPLWQPAPDVLGTPDGLAQQIYVRESRRIQGRSTLTQNDVTTPPSGRSDSVATGWYNLDIHPTCVSGHGANAAAQPFELPLGCFIPAAGGNLIPGCKNIATTHLAGACTRVHPVEWAVGEVAGLLAAQFVREGWPDRPAQVQALQAALAQAGVPRHWPPSLATKRAQLSAHGTAHGVKAEQ
jgi:hypothetical protein